jgi:hypothetical protein
MLKEPNMRFCPNPECGKEVKEGAVFCPFCGTRLAESEPRPTTETKRHISVTVCAVLLFISSFIHIINIVDFIAYGDLTSSIIQLFMCIFAGVAGYLLLKSKQIGAIIGIAYSSISIISSISLVVQLPAYFTVYDIIFDLCLDTATIILIVIGWKHLK